MVSKGEKIPDRKLAGMLGISHTMVRKYRLRGMPTNSEQSALAWLCENSVGRFNEGSGADVVAALERVETGSEEVSSPEAQTALADDDAPEFAENVKLDGLSQADLTKRLTAARIRLTDRDAEIRRLQGRQAQMDADLRDGKLLRAEEEHRKGFERATTLRNKLLALPAEWAVQLAAITDPAMVADFTRKRIKAALIEYCAAYGVTAESQ